jgi:hypothetical protein
MLTVSQEKKELTITLLFGGISNQKNGFRFEMSPGKTAGSVRFLSLFELERFSSSLSRSHEKLDLELVLLGRGQHFVHAGDDGVRVEVVVLVARVALSNRKPSLRITLFRILKN